MSECDVVRKAKWNLLKNRTKWNESLKQSEREREKKIRIQKFKCGADIRTSSHTPYAPHAPLCALLYPIIRIPLDTVVILLLLAHEVVGGWLVRIDRVVVRNSKILAQNPNVRQERQEVNYTI